MAGIMHVPKSEKITVPLTLAEAVWLERYAASQWRTSMAAVMRQALAEFIERKERGG